MTGCPVDRETTFAVCFCGRMLRGVGGSCVECGYLTPGERERRTDDLFEQWRRDAQAHVAKRRRRAQGRKLAKARR